MYSRSFKARFIASVRTRACVPAFYSFQLLVPLACLTASVRLSFELFVHLYPCAESESFKEFFVRGLETKEMQRSIKSSTKKNETTKPSLLLSIKVVFLQSSILKTF